jgi:type III protein arginine methyltransferase
MMAARAGADEVISCEQVLEVAEAARAVIAVNGLGDRVHVVAKASSELVIGEDMGGLADVLVFDNFGSTLIGLGALPTVEDAIRRLVKPGGAIIPARCAIKAAVAEDLQPGRQRMGKVQGFDLSPFNALAKPVYTISPESGRLAVRSSAATLFAFDFSRGGPFPAERKVLEVVGQGGGANGVVQWLEFAIDEEDDYRTGSGARDCAFGLVFHPTEESFEATSNEVFKIGASHDRNGLWIWLERS